jgi:Domain of unknown function (DUF4180)
MRQSDMQAACFEVAGVRVLDCRFDGATLRTERDALDRIGDALGARATMVLVSAEQCGNEFFELSTQAAGAITQKFVNYQLRLTIAGNILQHIEQSKSLSDFVMECNHGRQIWFVDDIAELEHRLNVLG